MTDPVGCEPERKTDGIGGLNVPPVRGLERKLDPTGRMAVPSDLAKRFSFWKESKESKEPRNLMVTLSLKGDCLYIFEPDGFKEWIDLVFLKSFGGFDPTSEEQIDLHSVLSERGDCVVLDKADRIGLAAWQLEEVGIKPGSAVKLFFSGNKIEVWDPAAWEEKRRRVDVKTLLKA
ncbi:MAG: hypothetical protein FWG23_03670 [Eggerthellaceae bacterium]|jgi:DNA-binding transcriptional regulator/RsmH inhibitor MraZ|nr:hypothetical protein [Eggerthellaceae bacterium]